MRVSTNMIYDQGVRALQTQSAALLYTEQQIATGRKILTPADDPVASARALDVTQSRSVNKQFTTNQGYAEDALKLVEGQLDGAGEIIQYARQRVLAAGNPALSDVDRKSIATDLRAQFDAML
ncbi:MAG: flagellar hook-associated protein 3, partial [Thauera sp.]|nr:flagellar hook-associated protein 3 [Thauera sp.]